MALAALLSRAAARLLRPPLLLRTRHLCALPSSSPAPSEAEILAGNRSHRRPRQGHPPLRQNITYTLLDLVVGDTDTMAPSKHRLSVLHPPVSVNYILYGDGAFLSPDDQKAVVEKVLVHHPSSEDKIGCGVDAIMVGKHPDFRKSRCLFIVRTNGETEDFSYRKCINEYIKQKYPSQADDFIQNHLTRRFTRQPGSIFFLDTVARFVFFLDTRAPTGP
uniref:Uncharacterized protein n=1 Tax=Oryza meridionalis TaxID=40149 RepID=A0A0E0EPE6_9ORYZ